MCFKISLILFFYRKCLYIFVWSVYNLVAVSSSLHICYALPIFRAARGILPLSQPWKTQYIEIDSYPNVVYFCYVEKKIRLFKINHLKFLWNLFETTYWGLQKRFCPSVHRLSSQAVNYKSTNTQCRIILGFFS